MTQMLRSLAVFLRRCEHLDRAAGLLDRSNGRLRSAVHLDSQLGLEFTPAEQPQWDQFAQVMRENARDMDQAFMQRAQQYSTMNAVQNMQSYEQIAEAHARHLQKLVPAFDNLYNTMPEQQKKLTDQVFRVNAERHAAQSRHGANATAK